MVLATLVLATLSVVAFDLHATDSAGMAPSVAVGDLVIVDRISGEFTGVSVDPGDVVMVRNPADRKQEIMGRVAAVELDEVRYDGASIFVNGSRLESTTHRQTLERASRVNTIIVPRGHFYLVGDNLNAAFDSRSFGPLPLADVTGEVRGVMRKAEPGAGWIGQWFGLIP